MQRKKATDSATDSFGETAASDVGHPQREEDRKAGSRDFVEARQLAIKTHNMIAQLSTEVREVGKRQDQYERGLSLNSFVAYVLFTILLGGAFYLLYQSRASKMVSESSAAVHGRQVAEEELARLRADAQARKRADDAARHLYELLSAGRRSEYLAEYPAVAREALSSVEAQVFREALQRVKGEIATASFNAGVDAFRSQQWKRAAQEFRRALPLEPEGPRQIQLRYYYGVALNRQGEHQDAVTELESSSAGGAERTVGPDIEFYLANSLDMLKQVERAKAHYRTFLERHPLSPLAAVAKKRLTAMTAGAAQ